MKEAKKPIRVFVELYVLVILWTVFVAALMPDVGASISHAFANRRHMLSFVLVLYFALLPSVFLLDRATYKKTLQSEQRIAKLLRGLRIEIYILICSVMVFSPLLCTLTFSYATFAAYPAAIKVNNATENGAHQVGSILLAAISDMHITKMGQTLEKQRDSLPKFEKTLRVLRDINAKVCILLGDSTDRGEEAEWELLKKALLTRDRKSIAFAAVQPLLVVPGNHDINGSPYERKISEANIEEQGIFGYKFTEEKFFRRLGSYFHAAQILKLPTHSPGDESITSNGIPELFEDIINDATHVKIEVPHVDPSTGRATVFLKYPEGFESKLERAMERFDEIFPINYADSVTGLQVILMNSSAKARHGSSIGLGDLGRQQLERFEKLLTKLMGDPTLRILVVALHHPPVKRSTDEWSWRNALRKRRDSDIFEHTYLALDYRDAGELLSRLGKFREARKHIPIILAHGHRHGDPFVGRTKQGIWVMEAPAVISDSTCALVWGVEALSPGIYALVLLSGEKQVVKRWMLNTKAPIQ